MLIKKPEVFTEERSGLTSKSEKYLKKIGLEADYITDEINRRTAGHTERFSG